MGKIPKGSGPKAIGTGMVTERYRLTTLCPGILTQSSGFIAGGFCTLPHGGSIIVCRSGAVTYGGGTLYSKAIQNTLQPRLNAGTERFTFGGLGG